MGTGTVIISYWNWSLLLLYYWQSYIELLSGRGGGKSRGVGIEFKRWQFFWCQNSTDTALVYCLLS